MQVVEISAFGAPEVLRIGARPKPVPASGEVLIRVTASSVNRPDVLQRLGKYPPPEGVSDIPGLDVAGVIESVHADSLEAFQNAGFKLGDRVCALVAGGGYAQHCVAPLAQCLPVPTGLTDIEAASLPETFFTVYSNVIDRGRLQAGETALIHGGSSGIGVAAIQLAKAWGAKVIVTVGSLDKCQACLGLGADHAINYKTQDFAVDVMRITEGRGVDLILDMVAGEYVAREVPCLAPDGRLVIVSVQGGVNASFDAGMVMRKRLTLTGSALRMRSLAFKADIAKNLREHVWPLLINKTIRPVVHSVFAPAQAANAHRLMESHTHIGKIVLTWLNSDTKEA